MTHVESDADRIARRYPASRTPRWLWIVLAVGLGLVGGTWMVWSALYGSNPPLSAKIVAWTVTSDSAMDVTVTTQRPDPGRPGVCTLTAQAESYETVGQFALELAPGTQVLEDHDLVIKTFKRATSVRIESCVPR